MTSSSAAAGPTIRIESNKVLGEVPQLVYGHFTEHLVHVIYDGIWGEMLYGRKFEDPMVHRVRHLMPRPWERFGKPNKKIRDLRNNEAVARHSSPHLTAHHSFALFFDEGHPGGEHGIQQPEIRADKKGRYVFRARVRRMGDLDHLRVALRSSKGKVLGETSIELEKISTTMFGDPEESPIIKQHPTLLWMDPFSWHEVTGTLTSNTTDHDALLSLTVDAPKGERAVIWFDWVSLMPDDTTDGIPNAVIKEFKDLPVACLKWPGGCMADNYDWRWGIGPRDARYPFMDQAWLGWDENDFGTDEFMKLCRLTDAEPYICINIGSGTAEIAAAWVEYCNGPADSRWGSVRAANGHPEPYAVKYWSMGNEQWGHFERGFDGPEGYAKRYLEYKEAMLKVDPTITVVAVGQAGDFNQKFLPIAGKDVDVLQIHHYSEEVHETDEAAATRKILSGRSFQVLLEAVKKELENSPADDNTQIALDEWGWSRSNHIGAIYTAASLNGLHRVAPMVLIGNRSCVINADGVIRREGIKVIREPVYEIFRLYNMAHRPDAVLCETHGDDELDASALGGDGGVSLFVVNAGNATKKVRVDGAPKKARVAIDVVRPAGKDPWGQSKSESREVEWKGALTLPPYSLTVARFI
ncbi:MAG TPA: hypothetical protein VND22_06455 [Actinomycetota bacterium]|nr:hypothetical protein [Actinomycetota bacterium]